MKRERLERYRSEQEEITELQYKMYHIKEESIIGNSVVLDCKSGYPVPRAVVAVSRETERNLKERYSRRIEELTAECKEVEDWIENIEDSMTRRIFRMHYMDGQRQEKIARKIHMSQSLVSKKISEYLKVE